MHEVGHDPDDMRTYYGVGALAEAFQGGTQAAIAAHEPFTAASGERLVEEIAVPPQPVPEPASATLALVLNILRDGTQSHASMVRRAVAAIERSGVAT